MANIDYSLYKIVIDPESKKTNGFQVGDVVRREYYDHPNLIYSLMVVMETGVDIIGGKDSNYFIGALIEGDAPQNGQLLDFVRITSLLSSQRSGAMYLTASDDQAPYMDVIDGLGLEQSLACPEGLLETPDPRDGTKYGFQSVGKMELRYNKNYEGSERSLTVISREASNIYSKEKWGVRQGIGPCPAYPAKLLISFRSRSGGSTYKDIPLTFGYADDSVIEATKLITVGKDYSYHLFEVSIDYPEQYDRFFSIILTGKLPIGTTLYISELNIVALSDLAALTNGTKVRVGKVKGIVDPVFGTLDGYGAYFQNLYATKNVNIAGTLTAGDEKGFASTFYVGKIHKNAVRNSIDGEFINNLPIVTSEPSPTGIGTVWDLNFLPTMILQDKEWRQRHEGEWYCFSIWLKSPKLKYFQVNVDKTSFHFYLPANEWIRHSMPFRVTYAEYDLRANLLSQRNDGILASSPQLEAGQTPSQYQPTDGTLSYVEDYGAWFNKGGIGGTIQNPLLRLNEDGSISSRDGGFIIYPDGTGQFASGRFKWSKDTITLQDFTIRWEDLSEDARENLKGDDGKPGKDGEPGKQGEPGRDGIDANLLDWVAEWNNGRTVITGDTLITPKIFAGAHNGNGTLTGTAIGHFSMITRNANGEFQSEVIDGIYGFRDGFKTFAIDSTGSVVFGRADNSISYDALTGKIVFGTAVSMQWIGATYIDKDGIFTGALSADTINAIRINADQIVAGTIGADRIDTAALKAELITAANIEALTLKVVRGKIGCWTIDSDSIYSGTKNNYASNFTTSAGSITIGSNGIRGYKWALESSGRGSLAGGKIMWDANGNVTFGASVSLYWINAAQDALDKAKDYADDRSDQAKEEAVAETTELVDATQELARAMAYGRMLYRDPTFYIGVNEIAVYNTLSNGNVSLSRTIDSIAPNDSKYILRIKNTGTSSPGCGGFRWMTTTQYRKVFITRIIAKIPVGRSIEFTTNSVGTGGSYKWLTSTAGTGDWTEYIHKVICGTSGFSATNFFFLSGAVGSTGVPVQWDIAYATVFDITSAEKLTTTIDANGIYTGTLVAEQVNAVSIEASSIKTGFLGADRIAAGSIKAEKLDANSIRATIINTDYINGLSLTFVQGLIGGWSIDSTGIYTGSFGTVGAVPIQLQTASSGSGYWYLGSYKPYGLSLLWHRSSNAGHLVFGQVAASASTAKAGFLGIQMMDYNGYEYFCLASNTSSNTKDFYNRIAGWSFDHQKIWKNNISLGADGSIVNGSKWKLNNDGSGQLASGNISWDINGNVSFSSAVSVNWQSEIQKGELYVRGTGYNNSAARIVMVNGQAIVQNSSRGITLTVIDRDTLTLVSTTNYDVYASDANCNSLATALNALSQTRIVVLSSYYGLRINATLNTAIQRCGGMDYTTGDVLMPFAFIGIPGIGKNTGLTVMTTTASTAPYAELSTLIINGTPEGILANSRHKTYINGNGIYTGTLTAQQINVAGLNASNITTGTLSVSRIAAGSITADKLDVNSLIANLITAQNINGLTLNFDKGTIGGWKINATSITSSTGNVILDNANKRIAVFGSGASSTSGARVMLHYTSTSSFGLQVLDASNSILVNLGYTNQIAGWYITANSIYKGSIYLGSDGSIYHSSSRWRLNNDGSGQIASGNISWNSSGTVTFSSTVSLNWTNGINAITTALGGTSYPKLTKITSTGIYTGTISASQITVDSTLVVGGSSYNGSVSVRNASNSVMVTLDRTGITAIGGKVGGWTLTSTSLYSGNVYLNSNGSIYNSSYWKLNSNGSGLLASNNIYWDAAGNITMKNATIQDVTIKGSIRAPFVRVDGAIIIDIGESGSISTRPDSEKYDNLCIIGGSDSGGWGLQTPSLAWTIDQSGRRLCLTHYRYNSEYVYGTVTFTAPSGKYFYEYGRQSSTLKMSRETVELMGYGSSTQFYGWIVLNRRDLLTTGRYGAYSQYLAMGVVTGSSSGATIKYKTYDGSTMSVTRNGTGLYTVYMPWSLGTTAYTVMMTGIWGGGPRYATIKTQYSSYFQVQTQDDSSANEGSFNFVVISTADFT